MLKTRELTDYEYLCCFLGSKLSISLKEAQSLSQTEIIIWLSYFEQQNTESKPEIITDDIKKTLSELSDKDNP